MMNRTDIEFDSAGTQCAAWLYCPEGVGPHPCVILAHGFGGVREARLDAYAERFTQAGLAAFVFDYRYFGASAGEPRQLLDIRRQLADWRAAIAFVRGLDGLDPERVALWGSSFSGGHVVMTAAQDHRIAAVVAQVPFMDGITVFRSTPLRTSLRLTVASLRDTLRRVGNHPPYYIKLAGAPGTLAAMTTPDADAGMRALLPTVTTWQDHVAARIILPITTYRPVTRAAKVQCPLLICITENDRLTPPQDARNAARLAPKGELRAYPGGHFDIYLGETFEEAVTDQCAFLTKYLCKQA
jgi:dienelactone hydrolase